MQPSTVFTIIVGCCGLLLSYLTYQNGLKKGSTSEGEKNGVLISDVGYIKSSVDNLNRKIEKQEEKYTTLVSEMSDVKSSVASAHKRIDEIRQEIKK